MSSFDLKFKEGSRLKVFTFCSKGTIFTRIADRCSDVERSDMNMSSARTEKDSIGYMEVPEEAYYGVQSQRARDNFPITGTFMHPDFISSMAKIKKAAAITNRNALRLSPDKSDAIIRACDEVIRGKFKEEFIVDPIQGGAGTSANMNINEVIANRAMSCWAEKRAATIKCIPTIM